MRPICQAPVVLGPPPPCEAADPGPPGDQALTLRLLNKCWLMVQMVLSGLHRARPHCLTLWPRILLPGATTGGSDEVRLVTQQPKTGSARCTGGEEQEDGDSPAPPELETRCLEVMVRPSGRYPMQECGLTPMQDRRSPVTSKPYRRGLAGEAADLGSEPQVNLTG